MAGPPTATAHRAPERLWALDHSPYFPDHQVSVHGFLPPHRLPPAALVRQGACDRGGGWRRQRGRCRRQISGYAAKALKGNNIRRPIKGLGAISRLAVYAVENFLGNFSHSGGDKDEIRDDRPPSTGLSANLAGFGLAACWRRCSFRQCGRQSGGELGCPKHAVGAFDQHLIAGS